MNQKIFDKLKKKYNFPKKDFDRYTKEIDGRALFNYVVLAHEADKKVEDIIAYVKNYKWPLDKKNKRIEFQIGMTIMGAVICSKESGYTFDEILKMTDYGEPEKVYQLEKKLNLDRSNTNKRLNDIRQELDLAYKDYDL